MEFLRTGSYQQRRTAVERIQQIPPSQRSDAIVFALSAEVDRLYEEGERLAAARATGAVKPPEDHGQYLFELVQALSEMESSAVLPSLVKAIGTGNRPMNAIVAFGELAVPAVMNVVRSKADVSPALLVLARMLERPVRNPLSAASRDAITALARELISAQQSGVDLQSIVELAAASRDPELVRKVQAISQSDATVRSLGVTDTSLIKAAQSRATIVLKERGLLFQ